MNVNKEHLLVALHVAITAQRKEEKKQGYTGDSGRVSAWGEILDELSKPNFSLTITN